VLRISLFGNLEVQTIMGTVCPFPTDKSRRLFAFLVLYSHRRFTRESLAANFWHCCDRALALKSLRAELWRMRRAIEDVGAPDCFHVNRHEVGFDRAAVDSIDLEEFETRIAPLSSSRGAELNELDARNVHRAIALYRGDILEDVYDDWAIVHRERMREMYLQALEILICFYSANSAWCDAVSNAQTLLSLDPLREHIHRQLIRFHYLRGDRAAAMQQYDICRDLLEQELGVQPMAETQELYRSIVSQQPASNAVFLPRERRQQSNNRQRLDEIRRPDCGKKAKSDTERLADSDGMISKQILDAALKEFDTAAGHIARARHLIQSIRGTATSPKRD